MKIYNILLIELVLHLNVKDRSFYDIHTGVWSRIQLMAYVKLMRIYSKRRLVSQLRD